MRRELRELSRKAKGLGGQTLIWLKRVLMAVESGVAAIALPPQSKIAVDWPEGLDCKPNLHGFTWIHTLPKKYFEVQGAMEGSERQPN